MKFTFVFSVVALILSSPVWATRVGNEASVPSVSISVTNTRSDVEGTTDSSMAFRVDESSSLREGTISGMTSVRNQIEINGSWLNIVAHKTRLFREGRAVSVDALDVGQLLKFTIWSDGSDARTLGVIYIP